MSNTKKKPLILVTNDDGITSPGIRALIEVAANHGEVFIVAPDSPQSGQGHAITITEPIRINEVSIFNDIKAYECSGTPADCVKIAKNVLLKDRNIDLCVSGINHGSNASINIIYSGTMSAAMEASLEGIPSIGFSLTDFSYKADFSGSKKYADLIIKDIIARSKKDAVPLLNVNIPSLAAGAIKGLRVCRQGRGLWVEKFKENQDPRGETYYWLTGEFISDDIKEDTDLWALQNGYVSVVPSQHDLTNYPGLKDYKFLEG